MFGRRRTEHDDCSILRLVRVRQNITKILNDCEATARGAETVTLPEAELLLQHTELYPSNSSSWPQEPMAPRPSTTSLTRYGFTPSSLLNSVVDYVIGIAADFDFSSLRSQPLIDHYFSGDGHNDSSSLTSSESTYPTTAIGTQHYQAIASIIWTE
ncbi:hypothetical protein ACFX2I_037019 [Malus domestica]